MNSFLTRHRPRLRRGCLSFLIMPPQLSTELKQFIKSTKRIVVVSRLFHTVCSYFVKRKVKRILLASTEFKPVTSILWSRCNAARIGNGSHCLQVQTCWMTHLRDFRGFLQLLLVLCNGKACAINIVYLQKRSYYHNNVYFHRKRIGITLLILSLFNEYYTAELTQTCHIRSTPKKRYESLAK